MICPRCGVENVEGSNYCRSCGQNLGVQVVGQSGTEVEPKTSGLAIASLVLSITGVCCGIGGIIGLILGCVALSQINNSNGRLTGKGLAIAGIVLGIVSILGMLVTTVLFLVTEALEATDEFVFLPQLLARWLV